MVDEPVARGAAGGREGCVVGGKVVAGDGDQVLGFQRILVGAQFQVGHGHAVIGGDNHQQRAR